MGDSLKQISASLLYPVIYGRQNAVIGRSESTTPELPVESTASLKGYHDKERDYRDAAHKRI